jgi:hypothetical protein
MVMLDRQARILFVENPGGTLSSALEPSLAGHHVEVARDAFDAIYRIDCAGCPHDVIFCDLACPELPAPELWAFLRLGRARAAERMVFVASAPLGPESEAFLDRVPNPCLKLPVRPEEVRAFVHDGPQDVRSTVARARLRALPSVRALEGEDDRLLREELRCLAVREQAAAVRDLIDRVEGLAPRGVHGSLRAQLVEELASLGCRMLEVAACVSESVDPNAEGSGLHAVSGLGAAAS